LTQFVHDVPLAAMRANAYSRGVGRLAQERQVRPSGPAVRAVKSLQLRSTTRDPGLNLNAGPHLILDSLKPMMTNERDELHHHRIRITACYRWGGPYRGIHTLN